METRNPAENDNNPSENFQSKVNILEALFKQTPPSKPPIVNEKKTEEAIPFVISPPPVDAPPPLPAVTVKITAQIALKNELTNKFNSDKIQTNSANNSGKFENVPLSEEKILIAAKQPSENTKSTKNKKRFFSFFCCCESEKSTPYQENARLINKPR